MWNQIEYESKTFENGDILTAEDFNKITNLNEQVVEITNDLIDLFKVETITIATDTEIPSGGAEFVYILSDDEYSPINVVGFKMVDGSVAGGAYLCNFDYITLNSTNTNWIEVSIGNSSSSSATVSITLEILMCKNNFLSSDYIQ